MKPFLIQRPKGAICAVHFAPAPGVACRGSVLFVPSFAEEMNRCRSMVSWQAREFARLGLATLVVDPHGTGDSAGEFAEADWEQWRGDLQAGLDWLKASNSGPIFLWGARLGAILAVELAAANTSVDRLLLWQPVVSGKQFLTNLLRVRIAAEMHDPNGVKTTDELRTRWGAGEHVELSGYHISPALAGALDALDLGRLALPGHVDVSWFDVLPNAEATTSRASTRVVEAWRSAGSDVIFETVVGAPFWQVHERELAPALVEATSARAMSWPSAGEPALVVTDTEPGAQELPVSFECGDDELVGMLHRGRQGAQSRKGVVIVVAGGPQYRAGAHRQFVSLARKLSAQGHPVVRFDLRGMGDSSGEYLGYQNSVPDIRAAVDALMVNEPALDEVVLFGECESASGILFYAWRDARVTGAVLVNPWVRTDEGRAQVIVKHYYGSRLRSREFWQKVFSGQFDWLGSLRSLGETLTAYYRGKRAFARATSVDESKEIDALSLPEKTAAGLRRFKGRVLLLMSGRDYIAQEFDEVTTASGAWSGLLQSPRLQRHDVAGADHTFSRAEWKDEASSVVVQWLGGVRETL